MLPTTITWSAKPPESVSLLLPTYLGSGLPCRSDRFIRLFLCTLPLHWVLCSVFKMVILSSDFNPIVISLFMKTVNIFDLDLSSNISLSNLCKHTYTITYVYVNNLEKALAPHSSTLAWKIPWMEEPGRLQSMGSLRVGHDCAISLSLFTFMHWRRKWQSTPVFLPGESQGRGNLVGCTRTPCLWGRTELDTTEVT